VRTAEPWKTEEWTDRDPDGFAPEEYNRAVATCRQRDELAELLSEFVRGGHSVGAPEWQTNLFERARLALSKRFKENQP
jgi:hypothetical protein